MCVSYWVATVWKLRGLRLITKLGFLHVISNFYSSIHRCRQHSTRTARKVQKRQTHREQYTENKTQELPKKHKQKILWDSSWWKKRWQRTKKSRMLHRGKGGFDLSLEWREFAHHFHHCAKSYEHGGWSINIWQVTSNSWPSYVCGNIEILGCLLTSILKQSENACFSLPQNEKSRMKIQIRRRRKTKGSLR